MSMKICCTQQFRAQNKVNLIRFSPTQPFISLSLSIDIYINALSLCICVCVHVCAWNLNYGRLQVLLLLLLLFFITALFKIDSDANLYKLNIQLQ
jgi:hypothetical protein